VAADVAEAYIQARGYQSRLSIARNRLSLQRRTLSLTQAGLEAGGASGLDLARAKGLVANTEASIPPLETGFRTQAFRIATLLGREPAAVLQRLAQGKGAVPTPKSYPSAGIPADLVRNRPDIRKAERHFAAAMAGIGVAEAELYPSLRLSGSLKLSASSLTGLNSAANTWGFGPTLDVPLFDMGSRQAQADVARSKAEQSRLAYRSVVTEAVEEVETALATLAGDRSRRAALERSAQSYRDALRMSQGAYETGSTTFMDVLDAERSLQAAQDALAQNAIALSLDYVRLSRVLGGGWQAAGGGK
jgi:multidrug efflux system outer membrane protein